MTKRFASVFVIEFGKWDVRGEIEAGPEATEQLDMLITQAFVHWRQAGVETPGSPGSLVIVDLDGFSVRQAGHFGGEWVLLEVFANNTSVICSALCDNYVIPFTF